MTSCAMVAVVTDISTSNAISRSPDCFVIYLPQSHFSATAFSDQDSVVAAGLSIPKNGRATPLSAPFHYPDRGVQLL
jgi:hypothetical protein